MLRTGLITTYLSLRLVVRSGFINIYPRRGVSIEGLSFALGLEVPLSNQHCIAQGLLSLRKPQGSAACNYEEHDADSWQKSHEAAYLPQE